MRRWPCLKIKGYVVLVVEDISEIELKHYASSKTSSPPPPPPPWELEGSKSPKRSEKRMEGRREKEEGTKESRREKKEKGSEREKQEKRGNCVTIHLNVRKFISHSFEMC